ncbi:hypothetical protein KEM55_004617 [Ascosphaera atra]|nr:hypothetical protein KEM55_004617 [Ascosphaera atra]
MRAFSSLILALPLLGQAMPTHSSLKEDPEEPLKLSHGRPHHSFPTWEESAALARRMLAKSTTGTFSTVYSQKDLRGVPIGLPDYFAACPDAGKEVEELVGDGNPLILALNIGTSFRNAAAGSNVSIAIDWWHNNAVADKKSEHDDEVEALIRAVRAGEGDMDDLLQNSIANLPRMSLLGYIEPLPEMSGDVRKKLESCYVSAHPDAVMWLPDDEAAAHSGYWARLNVQKVFWIGGFGDRARIGWIDTDMWKGVKRDGTNGQPGWDEVRLPGEEED